LRQTITNSSAVALMAVFIALVLGISESSARDQAATSNHQHLIDLAIRSFPNLTRAEQTLLVFADKGNSTRALFAIAGKQCGGPGFEQ
jgi:hypothetical protein